MTRGSEVRSRACAAVGNGRGEKQRSWRSPSKSAELGQGALGWPSSAIPGDDLAGGNLQQWLIGTYHGVGRHQLQAYLDEFVLPS